MNTYDQTVEMQELLEKHAETKAKLIKGIVLTAIGLVCGGMAAFVFGTALIWGWLLAIVPVVIAAVLAVPAIIFLAIGLPKLIPAVIDMIKECISIKRKSK